MQAKNTHSTLEFQELKFYAENGYLILENFILNPVCDLLISRAKHLIHSINPIDKTIFTTKKQNLDRYFFESANNIHIFYEEEAIDKNNELTVDKEFSVNKLGHALHVKDPFFYCFSRMHKLAMLCEALNIYNPKIVQSMYICKNPKIGSEVKPHQDSTYLFTEKYPVTGFWFALEDATIDNGCLWGLPEGHKSPLKSRLIRTEKEKVILKTLDNTPWEINKMVPLEVKKGSLIVLHGHFPHMSFENRSNKSRHAFTLHVMDSRSIYSKDNWLLPEKDFYGFDN